MKSSLDNRIIEALKNGPMERYEFARVVWPQTTHSQSWKYQSNGGPPAWVLSLGKASKRLGLQMWTGKGGVRFISR